MWTDRNSISSVLYGVLIILVSWFTPAGGSLIAVLADWRQGISIDKDLKVFPEFVMLKTLSGVWGTLGLCMVIACAFLFVMRLSLDLYIIVKNPYQRLQWFTPLSIFLVMPIFYALRARVELPRFQAVNIVSKYDTSAPL